MVAFFEPVIAEIVSCIEAQRSDETKVRPLHYISGLR